MKGLFSGCVMEWDGVSCWPAASEGQIVSVLCPLLLLKPQTPPGKYHHTSDSEKRERDRSI